MARTIAVRILFEIAEVDSMRGLKKVLRRFIQDIEELAISADSFGCVCQLEP